MKMTRKPTAGKAQAGYIISIETMLFVTIIVLGSIVGWVNIRDSFNAELFDTANAIEGAITFPYFSDPNRGTAVPVVPQTFSFPAPAATENCNLSVGCP